MHEVSELPPEPECREMRGGFLYHVAMSVYRVAMADSQMMNDEYWQRDSSINCVWVL